MLSNMIQEFIAVCSECGRVKGEKNNGNKKGVTRSFF